MLWVIYLGQNQQVVQSVQIHTFQVFWSEHLTMLFPTVGFLVIVITYAFASPFVHNYLKLCHSAQLENSLLENK